MNYGNIKYHDIADGIGVRTTLFVSGCTHHCRECFQPETWDFDYGDEFTGKEEDLIIESLKDEFVEGLTLLGGEPFEPENQKVLLPFLKRVREAVPEKSIWAYSGYTFDELMGEGGKRCFTPDTKEMLSLIDILVDGEFHIMEKDLTLRFRGSANQRVLDVKSSLEKGEPVLSPYNEREKLF